MSLIFVFKIIKQYIPSVSLTNLTDNILKITIIYSL